MGGSFRIGRSGGPAAGEMGRIYQTYQQGIGGSQNYLGLPATQSSLQRSPSLMDDTASLGTLSVTKFPNNSSKFMKRSASCASQFVSASRLPPLHHCPGAVAPARYQILYRGTLIHKEFQTMSLFQRCTRRAYLSRIYQLTTEFISKGASLGLCPILIYTGATQGESSFKVLLPPWNE